MIGPSNGPMMAATVGSSTTNRRCQKVSGTQVATAPAMRRPPTMSRRTAAHSMT